MADIVLGIGCAHAPQLHTPVKEWQHHAQLDTEDAEPFWYKGERVKYADLLERREQNLAEQMDVKICNERVAKSRAAINRISQIFGEADPDIAIIFGNDQGEMFLDDIRPAFTIMGCEQFENMPRTAEQTKRLPPDMTHVYGFIYKQIFRGKPVLHVPIDINTFSPPNQPDASRCYALGRMIGKAVRIWDTDARVAVIASGGLSHPVVDENFDRDIIHAMESGDLKYLLSYHDGYYQAGSSEIKTWIAMNGALRGTYLKGHLVDYEALYRTPAGTGSSAAFMYWCR